MRLEDEEREIEDLAGQIALIPAHIKQLEAYYRDTNNKAGCRSGKRAMNQFVEMLVVSMHKFGYRPHTSIDTVQERAQQN